MAQQPQSKLPTASSRSQISSVAAAAAAAASDTTTTTYDVDGFDVSHPLPASARLRSASASAPLPASMFHPALGLAGMAAGAFMRMSEVQHENPALRQLFIALHTRVTGFISAYSSAAIPKSAAEILTLGEIKTKNAELQSIIASGAILSLPTYESYIQYFQVMSSNSFIFESTGLFGLGGRVQRFLPIHENLERLIVELNQYKASFVESEARRSTQLAETLHQAEISARRDEEAARKKEADDQAEAKRQAELNAKKEEKRARKKEADELAAKQQQDTAKQLLAFQETLRTDMAEAEARNKASTEAAVREADTNGYRRGQDELMDTLADRLRNLPREIAGPASKVLQIRYTDAEDDLAADVSNGHRSLNGHYGSAAAAAAATPTMSVKSDVEDKVKVQGLLDANFASVEKLMNYYGKIASNKTSQAQVEQRIIKLIVFRLMAEKYTKSGQEVFKECKDIIVNRLGILPQSDKFSKEFYLALAQADSVASKVLAPGQQTYADIQGFRQCIQEGLALYLPVDASATNYFAALETNHPEYKGTAEKLLQSTVADYTNNFITRVSTLLGLTRSSTLAPPTPARQDAAAAAIVAAPVSAGTNGADDAQRLERTGGLGNGQ